MARSPLGPVHVLVVDGHPMMRFGLKEFLDGAPDLRVIGECAAGSEAMCCAAELRPDLVVLGLNLSGNLDGVEVCWALKNLPRPPRILVHASYNFDRDVSSCLLAGADSYVHKSVGCRELLDAVRLTAGGRQVWLAGERVGDPRSHVEVTRNGQRLTEKERQIVVLMLRGLSNEEIARRLHVSMPTVKSHVRSVLRKLGLKNRWELLFGTNPGN